MSLSDRGNMFKGLFFLPKPFGMSCYLFKQRATFSYIGKAWVLDINPPGLFQTGK